MRCPVCNSLMTRDEVAGKYICKCEVEIPLRVRYKGEEWNVVGAGWSAVLGELLYQLSKGEWRQPGEPVVLFTGVEAI